MYIVALSLFRFVIIGMFALVILIITLTLVYLKFVWLISKSSLSIFLEKRRRGRGIEKQLYNASNYARDADFINKSDGFCTSVDWP